MRSFAKALVVVLALPIVYAAVALASRSELDARWQATLRRPFLLRRQVPDEGAIARYSLASLCGDPRAAAGMRACRPYSRFSSLAIAAGASGALGVGFLIAIVAVGAACRSRRDRFVRLFEPALYATVLGLVALVLVQGALGVAGAFLVGDVVLRWPRTTVLLLGAAAAAATLWMVQVAVTVTKRRSVRLVARLLSTDSQPRLAAWMREVASATGASAPQQVLTGLQPGVFAAHASVTCLDGAVSGPALYLALPLARILSVEELRGLVAHELAHLGSAQAKESRSVRCHARARDGLWRLSRRGSGLSAVTTIPALWVLSMFMEAFRPAAASLFREREAAADRIAASLVGSRTFGSALLKLHVFAPAWGAVLAAMDRAVTNRVQYVNASALFTEIAAAGAGPDRLAGAGALSARHPVDVHPALADRLAALALSPQELLHAALLTQPSDPAVALIDGHEAMERELSQVEHRIAAIEPSFS